MNWSEVFSFSFQEIINNIFGGNLMFGGLWILMIVFGLGLAFRIDFHILLALLMPVTIVLMALGYLSVIIGGIIILMVAFILAFSWWQRS